MIESPDEIGARGTDPAHEQKIRQRAHVLWEREGRPEHRAEEHWRRAEREIADDEGLGMPGAADRLPEAPEGGKKNKVKASKEPKHKTAKEPKAKKAARREAAQPAGSRPLAASA